MLTSRKFNLPNLKLRKNKKPLSTVEYLEKIKSEPMPKGTYSWLQYANADMAWMCFREDAIRKLFHPMFCGNPYVEYSKYFTILNVFYKKRESMEKLRLKKAEMRHVDGFENLFPENDPIIAKIKTSIIEQKDYQGKAISQNLKYKVADVHRHLLKSCEIHFTDTTYIGIPIIPSRKLKINLKKEGLEGLRYMYIVCDTFIADVHLQVHVGTRVSKRKWKNVVVAFKLKKYEVLQNGFIGKELPTNDQRRALISAVSWWVPRDLEKRIEKRADVGQGLVRKLPERQCINKNLYVAWDHIHELVGQIQKTEHEPVIMVVDKQRLWRVSKLLSSDEQTLHLVAVEPEEQKASDSQGTKAKTIKWERKDATSAILASGEDKDKEDILNKYIVINESLDKKRRAGDIIFTGEVDLREETSFSSTEWCAESVERIHTPTDEYASPN